MEFLIRFRILILQDTDAVTALEYAFIGAFIAAVIVAGASRLGASLSTDFLSVSGSV